MPRRTDSEESDIRKKKFKKDAKKKRDYSDDSEEIRKKKKHKKQRQRSRSGGGDRLKKDKYRRRSRSRSDWDSHRDNYKRWDRGDSWRDRERDRQKQFMYDSPPSEGGDTSDDPEKMQKLRQLKAQQELISSKADRKLYLGNLPPNITAPQLMQLLNAALKKMQINTETEGDSIISAWINPDGVGHYAFIEFRTPQQATNGTALNNATLFGHQLKVGRPKQYLEYNKQLMEDVGNLSTMEGILKKIQNIGMKENVEQLSVQERIICPPTRIIVLKHIVNMQELSIDEEFQEIFDDVKDMAGRFGRVMSITIPRPNPAISLESAPTRVRGLGLVFIEYQTVDMAKYARKQFVTKTFSDKPVSCGFFDEQRYAIGDLDLNQKVVITY